MLLASATVAFTALGFWQVQRRAWKLDLIARVDARIAAPASAAPTPQQWASINDRDDAYRHVRATGVLLDNRETLVQALTVLGAGWWVLTPLQTADGTILVNRGFVPTDRREPAAGKRTPGAGPVTITGLLRLSEPGGAFLRSNAPANDRWYSRDVQAIAAARQLGPVAPFFIDADATPNPGGYPVGGLTVVQFPNNHLVYIVTWFLLAVLSFGGLVLLLRPRSSA